MHISNESESELWQTLSKQTQKVNLNLWAMGDHKLGKPKKNTVSTWPGVLQDQEKVYNLKNSDTR